MTTLRRLFHDSRYRGHFWLEVGIYGLIAISVLILMAELYLEPGSALLGALEPADNILTGVFLVEYALRLLTYRPPQVDFYRVGLARRLWLHVTGRLRFAATPMMLVDLGVVLSLSPPLRGLRALRLFRLLRATRVFRYSNPFEGLVRAFVDNRLLFLFGLSLLFLAAVVGGVSLYMVERSANPAMTSVRDGLWWALVTLTTVGYGDITPHTELGRILGGLLMISGMFCLALFAGLVGRTMLGVVLGVRVEQLRMSSYVNHLVVCGYTPGARLLLDAIQEELDVDDQLIVLFGEGERPESVPHAFAWVSGDPTKESELDKARLSHAKGAIIIGSDTTRPQQADAKTLLTLFTIRSYMQKRPEPRVQPLYVVAEILDTENVGHATSAGADEVVETTRVGYSLMVHSLLVPGSGAILSDVVSARAQSVFVGKPPADLLPSNFGKLLREMKKRTGVLVMGLRDPQTGRDSLNPDELSPVSEESLVIYLAPEAVLEHG